MASSHKGHAGTCPKRDMFHGAALRPGPNRVYDTKSVDARTTKSRAVRGRSSASDNGSGKSFSPEQRVDSVREIVHSRFCHGRSNSNALRGLYKLARNVQR
jgi:hypothetical protein